MRRGASSGRILSAVARAGTLPQGDLKDSLGVIEQPASTSISLRLVGPGAPRPEVDAEAGGRSQPQSQGPSPPTSSGQEGRGEGRHVRRSIGAATGGESGGGGGEGGLWRAGGGWLRQEGRWGRRWGICCEGTSNAEAVRPRTISLRPHIKPFPRGPRRF